MNSRDTENWVFGYGSLMWRPGFAFIEQRQALVRGVHRRLCIYSWHHRGTPERPGLVMGLDRGGACRGIAFRVADEDWADTVDYLRAREQVTMVYRERHVSAQLVGAEPRTVSALTYVANRRHEQYAGSLSIEEQERFARQGHGQSGPCVEYVVSFADHIRQMGLSDHLMEGLAHRLTSC